MAATWTWEETNPDRSGSSGDLSKLFKYETADNPGVMAIDAPPPSATLMAREVIQNSWDAARDLGESLGDGPRFRLQFRFSVLDGSDSTQLIEALDLKGQAAQIGRLAHEFSGDEVPGESDFRKAREQLGLRESDCLKTLDSMEGLPILVITEHGTIGMGGPWKNARSRMYLALVSLGYTDKGEGAGGSYGYGKVGLIRGSATRTLVAYSCFPEQDDDPGVTRRLLGMTYWGQHDVGDVNFTGFARYGEAAGNTVRPFENDAADEVAASLGLRPRSPDYPEDWGTTFIVIDPTVQVGGLRSAIERSWWPAIEEDLFDIELIDVEGGSTRPRPRDNSVLQAFLSAFDLVTERRAAKGDQESVGDLGALALGSIETDTVGRFGLVADLEGWSYADQGIGAEGIDHRSLVALMRSPHMVVQYYDAGVAAPYVRGVFVADDSVDETLRRTEPKGHDKWETRVDDDSAYADDVAVAKRILERLRRKVGELRKRLKPAVPPPEEIDLPMFDALMRRVLSGLGRGVRPPDPETRPVTIRLEHDREPVGDDAIRLRGSASFCLSEHCEDDEAAAEVMIAYRFLEDGRLGEHAQMEFDPPDGFTEVGGGRYRGTLTKDADVLFGFETAPYSMDWTGRLVVNGDLLAQSIDEEVAQ